MAWQWPAIHHAREEADAGTLEHIGPLQWPVSCHASNIWAVGDKNPTQVDVTCKGRVFWRGLNVGYRKVSGEKISKFLWAGQNSSDKVTISFRAVKIGKWSRPGQPDQRYYNRCTNKLLTFQPRALQAPVSPSVICPRRAHTGDFAKTSSELTDNFAAVIIMKWTRRENVM